MTRSLITALFLYGIPIERLSANRVHLQKSGHIKENRWRKITEIAKEKLNGERHNENVCDGQLALDMAERERTATSREERAA
jgi:hypothetical protein